MKTLNNIVRDVSVEKNRDLEPKKVDNYNFLTIEEKAKADKIFEINNINYQKTLINSMKDGKKDLKKILKGLNVDIDKYKNKGKYEFPSKLAELFKIFLMEDGKKGGFISKIRKEKFDSITENEKISFLNEAMKKLEIGNIWSKEEVQEVRHKFTNDIYYNKIVEKISNRIISDLNKKIEYELKQKIKNENKCGILRPAEKKERINFDLEDFKKGSRLIHLDPRDRIILLKYMEVVMDEAIGKWRSVGVIADEIKAIEIDELMETEDEELIDEGIESIIFGKKLLEESIEDYENSRKKRTPIDKESLEEAEKYFEELEDSKIKIKFKEMYPKSKLF